MQARAHFSSLRLGRLQLSLSLFLCRSISQDETSVRRRVSFRGFRPEDPETLFSSDELGEFARGHLKLSRRLA